MVNFFLPFTQDLGYLNLIVIPIYAAYRIRKNVYTLLNPCLYLLILAYLYLTISSIFLDYYIDFISTREPWLSTFSSESIAITSLLCHWFTLVFLGWYIFSKDPPKINLSFFPQKITYQLALIVTVIITGIFAAILVTHGSEIFAQVNRNDALEYFAHQVLEKYKYSYLLSILLACLAIINWRKLHFKWYLVLIIPIITELLSKGRNLSFTILVFTYMNYIAVTKKTRLLMVALLFLALLSTVFWRLGNSSFEKPTDYLVYLFSEIFATRMTTIIAYNKFLDSGDLGSYLLYSILNILPVSMTQFWVEIPTNYVDILQDFYSSKLVYSRTGLAGNIVSESLYYGGMAFGLVSPLIIGFIIWSINQLKIYKTLPGFLYYCFLVTKLQVFVRVGFYYSFISLVTFMFSLMLWIILLEYKNNRINPKLNNQITLYFINDKNL